jgi:hypothetical protein
VFQRNLTVVSNGGFLVGEPKNGGNIVQILRALKRRGINVVEFDAAPGSTNPFFSPEGKTYVARVAGVTRPPTYDPFDLRPNEAFLKVLPPGPDGDLCARLPDGEGVAVLVGNPPANPRVICPLTADQRREALKR